MTTTLPPKAAAVETMADLVERLGGVPLQRIRMNPLPGTATERDVVEVEARENRLCELVDGVLVEKGMGYRESVLAMYLVEILGAFVRAHKLGRLSGEGGMVSLLPGSVRIPDVAFVSVNQIPQGSLPRQAAPALVPELVVEILSPSNTPAEMARKRREYFQAGVQVVWEVDPGLRTVAVYAQPDQVKVLHEDQTIDGGQVIPGLSLELRQWFGQLDGIV